MLLPGLPTTSPHITWFAFDGMAQRGCNPGAVNPAAEHTAANPPASPKTASPSYRATREKTKAENKIIKAVL